jgi:ketosteroid isomerase-like protein
MPSADDRGEEALVRQVLESRAQAIRTKNTDAVLSHYADDLTVFELAPPLSIGAEEALDRRSQEQWFRGWRGPIGWETRDLRITVGGDVAFSYALNRLSGTSVQGERTDMWVRQTLGFRRIDGAWNIAHEHTSVPFYMDGTDSAAVDLEP